VLARFAAQRGLTEVGLLYPAGAEFREEVQRFRTALESAGGRIVADVAWEPGTTTFQRPLERLRAARPRAIFVAAGERDIRQLAPQLAYYGLSGVQILGSEGWASEEVLTRVDPGQIEGVVAAVPFLATSRSVAWDEFVGLYEAAQRRSLDTPYPALGWDAARLVLAAIGDDRPSRAEVARRLAEMDDFRGATGVLSLAEGSVTRRPFLVRVRAGRAEPIPEIGR
jgi:ABC-type branched-subunit amino acid transport system substrate-binding protein